MQRSSLSVPSNLAEGLARSSPRERARFTEIALSSSAELEYQLLFARDAGYLADEDYQEMSTMVVAVKSMLTGLLARMRERCP
jgi:four helix bundle protein